MAADDRQARRYVERMVSPATQAARLNRDLLAVQAELEVHERHAARLKALRDSLLQELVAIDD